MSAPTLWRASPRTLTRLVFGQLLFGAGEAVLLASELGNTPWTVLAEGVSVNSTLSVGAATIAISLVVMLLWIPLDQRPGLGTVANTIVIGLSIDLVLGVLPVDPALGLRWAMIPAGIALVGLGSGLYITCALGPGPRDGLMTGLARTTGSSFRLVRTGIEAAALVAGFVLGGTVGVGTVAFALLIGPAVHWAVDRFSTPEWRALEAAEPNAALTSGDG